MKHVFIDSLELKFTLLICNEKEQYIKVKTQYATLRHSFKSRTCVEGCLNNHSGQGIRPLERYFFNSGKISESESSMKEKLVPF